MQVLGGLTDTVFASLLSGGLDYLISYVNPYRFGLGYVKVGGANIDTALFNAILTTGIHAWDTSLTYLISLVFPQGTFMFELEKGFTGPLGMGATHALVWFGIDNFYSKSSNAQPLREGSISVMTNLAGKTIYNTAAVPLLGRNNLIE